MDRRLLLGLIGAGLCAPAALASTPANLSAADQASIDAANAYLQGLDAAKGRFEQTSPRGAVSTGDLYVQRPGKARFAYDPQFGLLVVADGKSISVYDSRLKTFDKAPLNATPLGMLLSHEVRLDRDVQILRVDHYADYFALTLRDATGRADGRIVLYFNAVPVSLRGWTVIDAQNRQTQVRLLDLHAEPVDPDLFVLRDPRVIR
ncbi:MAG TPA: outer membrane lipoprotein carrier protein LolA [Caulobacteraceae bacterium]|nr:outer membrane lipoprotein carrier protein LolA [Caulobacteraceae bacterium]